MGIEGLAPIDGWAVAAVIAKAIGYYATLLAMGGPLFLAAFPAASDDVRGFAKRITVFAALAVLVVLMVRFGIRSARISGMGFPGAFDPMMLGFVWESPLGTAAVWKATGAILTLTVLMRGPFGRIISLAGSLMIAVSFASVGHSLGDPRLLLAVLLMVHVLAAAFWVAALLPLYRSSDGPMGAALLHRFGIIASGTVALLIVVGAIFAVLMTGSVVALFSSAYGWALILKIATVTGLMGLAALNKWRLVPALADGQVHASVALRRSIRLEAVFVGVVLIITAALTSVTTPPVNL